MDRRTLADKQKVRKMSDERLRAKLVDAGHDKTDIELTEREELLDLFANLLVQTQAQVSVSEPPAPAMDDNLPPSGHVSGDPGLEREMFEFDKRKWEAEERYREFEMRKWEAEERHKEFERQKWEAERQESHQKWDAEKRRKDAEREERDRKWEAEWEDRKAEFELKKNEAAKQDTSVGKNKIFSDAMRSSAIRMSDDPIEAIAFFYER